MSKKKIEIPPRMKRINFFDGRLLTTADFRTEQAYFMNQMRLYNVAFHGSGIISGLEVSLTKDTPCQVIVNPGIALDQRGNFAILPVTQQALLPEKENVVYIVLYWAEREIGPIPLPAGESETMGSLIEEYTILKFEAKRNMSDPIGIELARLKKTSRKWKLDKQFRPRRARA